MLYLTREMGESPAAASIQVMVFEGTCYLTPLLGAWLADSSWGALQDYLVFLDDLFHWDGGSCGCDPGPGLGTGAGNKEERGNDGTEFSAVHPSLYGRAGYGWHQTECFGFWRGSV